MTTRKGKGLTIRTSTQGLDITVTIEEPIGGTLTIFMPDDQAEACAMSILAQVKNVRAKKAATVAEKRAGLRLIRGGVVHSCDPDDGGEG